MIDGSGRSGHPGQTVQICRSSVARIYSHLGAGHAKSLLPLMENIAVEAINKNNNVLLYHVGRKVSYIFPIFVVIFQIRELD
jgi:hypothetical protein